MTATQTHPTTRAFGKCSRKGCRHTHVTALEARGRAGIIYFTAPDGLVWQAAGGYFPQVDAAMRDAGLVCPDHGATMIYVGIKATYNPEKVCDGRCMNAKRPNCDCSCNGENHGNAGCP